MNYQTLDKTKRKEIARLFTSVFISSEGEEEGTLIGNLSAELASSIDNEEIICFGIYENERLIASIFFTRLRFNNPIQVYMLAPVAVSSEYQRKGIGQALINYGLNEFNRFVLIM